ATNTLNARGDRRQTKAWSERALLEAAAVIAHIDEEDAGVSAHVHVDPARSGMSRYIAQCLLDHSVGGETDRFGQTTIRDAVQRFDIWFSTQVDSGPGHLFGQRFEGG